MTTGFSEPDVETSNRMRKVRSRGTGLEKNMQQILEGLSVKYEMQPNILGHPDFRIKGERIVIFCDSSFWHGRLKDDVSGRSFHKNKKFWAEKLATTKRRDRLITQRLTADRWKVLRFWDTDILQRTDLVRTRLRRAMDPDED
jgi:DNA mismatch endonuclease (patch repair protein)